MAYRSLGQLSSITNRAFFNILTAGAVALPSLDFAPSLKRFLTPENSPLFVTTTSQDSEGTPAGAISNRKRLEYVVICVYMEVISQVYTGDIYAVEILKLKEIGGSKPNEDVYWHSLV